MYMTGKEINCIAAHYDNIILLRLFQMSHREHARGSGPLLAKEGFAAATQNQGRLALLSHCISL
jgi:hypothetical protein